MTTTKAGVGVAVIKRYSHGRYKGKYDFILKVSEGMKNQLARSRQGYDNLGDCIDVLKTYFPTFKIIHPQ